MSLKQANVLFDIPGPKARRRNVIIGIIGSICIAALIGLFIWGLSPELGIDRWKPFLDLITWKEYIIPGLSMTLLAAITSVICASLLGFLLGLGRLTHITPIRWIISGFVEFFRSVPVLIMMIASYFLFLQYELVPPSFLALAGVVTGLTLYNSCVMAELIRSGVHSLSHGQREAGLAIGLTRHQTLLHVLVPQSITAMMPSLVSQLIVILKDTALGYIITYNDLLLQATHLASWQSNTIATYIVVAMIFIVINWFLGRFAIWLRERTNKRLSRRPEIVRANLVPNPDPDDRLYADPLEMDEEKDHSYEGYRRHYFAPEELEHDFKDEKKEHH